MPAKKRRQRSGQQVHTAAAQAKARDQDTIRLINQALADGHVRHLSVLCRTIQDSIVGSMLWDRPPMCTVVGTV